MTVPDRRAAFLDRDGTLIEDAVYPRDPALVRLMPGAAEALDELRRQDYLLVLVSNQSGIGRGLITPDEAAAVHARFVECLRQRGVEMEAFYYCPHTPDDGCACRKPEPGMLLQAVTEWGIDPRRSFLVGDKLSDVEAGRRAGCATALLTTTPTGAADIEAAGWPDVLDWILRRDEARPQSPR